MSKSAKPTVYLETTILSYVTSRSSRDIVVSANQQITQEWWEQILPKCEAVISVYVIDEVRKGDAKTAERRLKLAQGFDVVKSNKQIEKLAQLYLSQTRIPDRAKLDAYHIACATAYAVDYLLTWNCTHIASAIVRRKIEIINQ